MNDFQYGSFPTAHKFSSWNWKLYEKKNIVQRWEESSSSSKILRVSTRWKLGWKSSSSSPHSFTVNAFSTENLNGAEMCVVAKLCLMSNNENLMLSRERWNLMNKSTSTALIYQWNGKCLFVIVFSFFLPQKIFFYLGKKLLIISLRSCLCSVGLSFMFSPKALFWVNKNKSSVIFLKAAAWVRLRFRQEWKFTELEKAQLKISCCDRWWGLHYFKTLLALITYFSKMFTSHETLMLLTVMWKH